MPYRARISGEVEVRDMALIREDKNFRHFLWGRLIAEIGSRITREGLPIVAVLAVGATSASLGLLAALTMLPGLVLGTPVGNWVDRVRRRPILMGANLFRAGLLLCIPLAALLHHLRFWEILVVSTLVSAVSVAFHVADRAYFPFLVTRSRLDEGNRILGSVEALGETTGPAVMGILIQLVGAPFALIFDALSNVVSAVSLGLIRKPEPMPSENRPPQTAGSGHRRTFAGLRVLRSHPVIRPLAITMAQDSFFGGFHAALYEIYALKTLHLSPLELGILITTGGFGSFVGSFWVSRVTRRLGLGRAMRLTFGMASVLTLAVPLAHGPVVVAFVFLLTAQVFGDLFATMYEINARIAEQALTPDHWLGRVEGGLRVVQGGLGVIGALLAGLLALWITPRGAIWVASLGTIAAGLWLWNPNLLAFHRSDQKAEHVWD